jgi:hypothetical protein
LTTVPFLHTSSTLKADDSLSKADSVPWIGTRVIIVKLGDPFKGYMGVVKDVLRGQDTASGLKIALQLEHLTFSSPFKTIVVDYDSVVEKRSVKDLHLQDSESIRNNAFFKDWIFTLGLFKAPKRSLSASRGLYEVCAPAFRTFTTVPDAWGINFWRSHPHA